LQKDKGVEVKSGSYRLREELAHKIGNEKPTRNNINKILFLLKDKNLFVKIAALETIMQIGYRKNFLNIVPLLLDKDELIRVNAVEAIAELGGKKASKYIVNLINDRSEIVRMFVATALGEIGNRRHVSILVARMKKERSDLARIGIFSGLYGLGQLEVLSDLVGMLKNERYHVRCATANTLGDLVTCLNKKLILKYLLKALKNEELPSVIGDLKKNIKIVRSLKCKSL